MQRLGRPDKAREAYHLAVRKCRTVSLSAPGAVDSYIFRALALKELGEYPKALELVDYVLLLAPESAEVHSAKAVILQDMGRAEEARLEIRATESVNKVLGAVLRAAQKGG